ncbi:MAG TPA: ATP-binding protein [Gemmataceae bacterium]
MLSPARFGRRIGLPVLAGLAAARSRCGGAFRAVAAISGPDANSPVDSRLWRTAFTAAGIALWLIGIFTLAAWAVGHPELTQITPSLAPLHYNAALAFIIWGAAYHALVCRRYHLASATACVMFSISFVLFAAEFMDLRIKVDRWLFAPPANLPLAHDGSPPPLVFGLVFASVAILLAARRELFVVQTLFGTLIGLILVIGSPTALVAALAGNALVVESGLTILGAIASTTAGLALLASPFRGGIPTFARCYLVPLAVGSAGITISFALWTGLILEQNSRLVLSLPKLALLLGLATTSLLALLIHLAQTALRRTADLEKEVREREQTQHALKQSEEKYRSLIENLGQGIFLLGPDLRYQAANATFCRHLGRGERAVIGFTDADFFDCQRAEKHAEEARTVLAEGKAIESEEERDLDGQRVSIRRVLTPVRDASGCTTGVLGICWDVTDQRRLEAHVHQASKMDAIGQLAGGIAHDFNNLLTAILGNLDLLLEDAEASPTTQELASAAHGAATRATSLTQRLLGFARRHKLDWRPTDVNPIAEEVADLLRRTINPLIRIEMRLDPDLWPVQADPTQLNQVLMNLCLNARDALPQGGRISVESARLTAAELPPDGLAHANGEFVRIRIADTGCGMTEEVQARIYEPFFTTKEVGKGTGLGLPMVFAIVRQHKGWIACHSEVGRGTRFDVYLPRGETARETSLGALTPMPRRAGKETVLVVDDEEMIRRVAALTLKTHGYSVLEAADGQQAVDLYSREGDRIDLVLLDLTMPILSGLEAFRHLIQLNSRVKVVFASGFAEEQLSDFEKELTTGFLKKPYRPSDLMAAVMDALVSPSRGSGGIKSPPRRVELAAFV